MAARSCEKEPLDLVHQNQIFCETVRKELRCQKLHTEYGVNPLKRVHTITRKPMSWHDNIEEPADGHCPPQYFFPPNPTAKFLNLIHHAALEPTRKYTEPQTESQEIGWNTTPLISVARTDRRLYFPCRNSEITKYMAAMWRLKEQSENMQ
ncbi:protein FAM183A isoform X2 [Gopherus evgoodei]|uniref:protein FAM183A isoform X2 n=1 Tax=Gopherus evgoodei TaxID=1825980 RepID=UPI0011CFBB94|nr:protein FAM183A isoform X2 [Gopherus evgoodei]